MAADVISLTRVRAERGLPLPVPVPATQRGPTIEHAGTWQGRHVVDPVARVYGRVEGRHAETGKLLVYTNSGSRRWYAPAELLPIKGRVR